MAAAVTERAWCVIVPHHARGARLARHRLVEALTGQVKPEVLADATAVAAELIGNAVRHAAPLPGGVIRVGWRVLAGGGVQIRVTDGGSTQAPQPRDAEPDALDGRGLTIVGALATSWGFEREGSAQAVWADLG